MTTRADSPSPRVRRDLASVWFLRWSSSIAVLLLSLGTLPPATSAEGATGAVSGRVKNAVTGLYLSNARIAVQGTDQIAFTDDSGAYNLVGLKSGPVVLEVSYTNLDVRTVPVVVAPGQTIRQDVELTSLARYGESTGATKLDPFIIGANREEDAESLAINEQRYAANIKNVVATDSMGDMVGGSAGEFMKYIPGLVANYDSEAITSVSVRGFSGPMTAVEADGLGIESATHGTSRTVNLHPLSINQVSRIEVAKVPLPSRPADSIGGSVNLISKNAFEQTKDELRYSVYLTGNLLALDLKRTPHAYWDNQTHKLRPGFDFDYKKLITPNFGVTLSATYNETYSVLTYTDLTWNTAGTGTGATDSDPYLQTVQLYASRRTRMRSLYGLRADWRVTPNSILTFGVKYGKGISARTGRNTLTFNAGTNAAPVVASGTRMSFGPDFTEGAQGRGTVTLAGTGQWGNYDGSTNVDTQYRFDNGMWKVEAGLAYSHSTARLSPRNTFTAINAVIAVPNRVVFHEIGKSITPGSIKVFDDANREIDVRNIDNYRMTSATQGNNQVNEHLSKSGKLDIARRIGVFGFPATLQTGVLQRVKSRDRRTDTGGSYSFVGTNHSPVPYLGQNHSSVDFIDFPNVPATSAFRGHEAFAANPAILSQTPAQVVSAETARLGASEYIEETVGAYYLQAEARLLQNRLHILTGVRYERTDLEGQGLLYDPNLVFVRNPDGSFAHNAQGARIRKPEAGAAGSLDEAYFVRKERGYTAERSYDGYYPSLHFNYNVTENFITRLAYARSYGRPNFASVIPNTSLNEADLDDEQLADPEIIKGTITVRNTGLKPWHADNYDFSMEYYTKQGGVFSAGVFRKEITDFFGDAVQVATPALLAELGLDPIYEGWRVSTSFNSGDARVTGFEFNLRQSLRAWGSWGRYFTVFANVTKMKLEGDRAADFSSFVPRSASWGFSYNWKRISIIPKWTSRGRQQDSLVPAVGTDGALYIGGFTKFDVNLVYRFSANLSLTCSINNVFNAYSSRQLSYGKETPKYAHLNRTGEYGPAFSLGVKGSF